VHFSSNEELRPTGTDRGTLRRIAEVSGGKMRDTLAGIFDDRAARRRAYRSANPSLLALAAVALLVSVAGRRAGIPDVVSRWVDRLRRPPTAKPTPIAVPTGTTAALLTAKAARRAARTPSPPAGETKPNATAAPLKPAIRATLPTSPSPPPPPHTRGPDRPLSAAEILLARRRQRR